MTGASFANLVSLRVSYQLRYSFRSSYMPAHQHDNDCQDVCMMPGFEALMGLMQGMTRHKVQGTVACLATCNWLRSLIPSMLVLKRHMHKLLSRLAWSHQHSFGCCHE